MTGLVALASLLATDTARQSKRTAPGPRSMSSELHVRFPKSQRPVRVKEALNELFAHLPFQGGISSRQVNVTSAIASAEASNNNQDILGPSPSARASAR